MKRAMRLGLGADVLTSGVILFGAVCLRIEPLPSADQIREEARRRQAEHHAALLRDVPSLQNLPAIEPMNIEQALILEHIDGLNPTRPERSKPWHPPDKASQFVPEMDFRVEYVDEKASDPPTVVVEVHQYPNDAWPLYFAKWSPNSEFLQEENPEPVLTRVKKFENRVVMDRQYRSSDETGKLWFFWPSRRNLVSVTYTSKAIDERLLRYYLEKYPSSL